MSNISLDNINIDKLFGKDHAQEDDNLTSYFLKTNDYKRVISGEKSIVLGRKGAGKSAIYKYITEVGIDGSTVVGISPTEKELLTVTSIIRKYNDSIDFNDDLVFAFAWKECIMMEIAVRTLQEDNEKLTKYPTLHKHLKNNGFMKGDTVSKFAKAITDVVTEAKFSAENCTFSLSSFKNITDPENNILLTEYQNLLNEKNIFVVIDNLDEAWKNNEQMNSWIRGLVKASKIIRREYKNISISIMLRSDIHSILAKGNSVFDARNEILTLDWKKNNSNLKKLIATRIACYFKHEEPKTPEDTNRLLEYIFPSKICYMTKRNTRELNLFDYLIDKTFSRPREIIQFCRLILEYSQDSSIPISDSSVESAESSFSLWKVEDLSGEYSSQYRGIDTFIKSLANVSDNWSFNYPKINTHLSTLEDKEKIIDILSDKPLNAQETISLLYEIAFFRKVQKKRKGQTYITSDMNPNINPKTVNLDIHPAFRKLLTEI